MCIEGTLRAGGRPGLRGRKAFDEQPRLLRPKCLFVCLRILFVVPRPLALPVRLLPCNAPAGVTRCFHFRLVCIRQLPKVDVVGVIGSAALTVFCPELLLPTTPSATARLGLAEVSDGFHFPIDKMP